MQKISNFILSKDSLICTLFLVQFNLCAMYSQSYFGINHEGNDYTIFAFWKALIISLVVSLAFANVTINVITRSKNKNDGYMFACFDFLVYCAYYGNKCVEWYSLGLYGNIFQALLFAVITSVAILKLSELFLADIETTSKEQDTILELATKNELLTNNVKELTIKLDLTTNKLDFATQNIQGLTSNNENLIQKLNELSLLNDNLSIELENKELELVEVGAELSEFKQKEPSLHDLKQTLKGTKSQRTTQAQKGKDVTILDQKIKELEFLIQKKEM